MATRGHALFKVVYSRSEMQETTQAYYHSLQ